jgi:hypothetical protein
MLVMPSNLALSVMVAMPVLMAMPNMLRRYASYAGYAGCACNANYAVYAGKADRDCNANYDDVRLYSNANTLVVRLS